MRSRLDFRALALAALVTVAPAFAADDAPTPTEIQRAVDAVKADPKLSEETTITSIRWKGSNEPKEKKTSSGDHEWLGWFEDFFKWIAQSSRLLLWLLLAGLAAVLATFVVRMIGSTRFAARGTKFVAPTHVQDLDIRPESLPDDIGGTARALWDRGEQRAALALLYRGLLSRLAHAFEVPIRDSSTEGDCITLAARKLDASRVDYVTRLVRTWQRAIYGGLMPDAGVVHELCATFATQLGAPPAAPQPRGLFERGEAA